MKVEHTQHSSLIGLVAIAAAFIAWGASNPIYKLGLQYMDPMVFGYVRFLLATLIIGFMLFYQGKRLNIPLKDFGPIAIATFFGIFLKISLLLYALPHISALSVSLIFAAGPVFTFFVSAFFLKEPYKKKHLIGMSVAFLGTLFTVIATAVNGGSGAGVGMRLDALMLIIIAMLTDIVYILISKKVLTHTDPISHSFVTFFCATMFFFPFAMWQLKFGIGPTFIPNATSIFTILYATVISSIIGYLLFNWGLAHARVTKASVLGFLDPVAAFLIAGPLLGEHANIYHVVGFMLVMGGIYWAEHHVEVETKHKHHLHRIR